MTNSIVNDPTDHRAVARAELALSIVAVLNSATRSADRTNVLAAIEHGIIVLPATVEVNRFGTAYVNSDAVNGAGRRS